MAAGKEVKNLKSKLDGDELDLSLSELSVVPVREIVSSLFGIPSNRLFLCKLLFLGRVEESDQTRPVFEPNRISTGRFRDLAQLGQVGSELE